jgi:hypothetical protein
MSSSTQEEENFNYEILLEQNRLRISHVFNQDIQHIFNLYRSVEHYKQMYGIFLDNIVCLKGNEKYFTTGSEYSFTYKGQFPSKILFEDIIETETCKSIQFFAYDLPNEFKFRIIYKFFKNTTDGFTYFYFDNVFFSLQALSFHRINFNNKDSLKLSKHLEHYIAATGVFEQVESIVIKIGFKELWSVVTDWKEFKKRVPIIADYIEDDSDGFYMRLRYSGDKAEYFLQVLKNNNTDDCLGDFELRLSSSNSDFTSQEMHFKVVALDDKCLLVFKHVFKSHVNCNILTDLSDNKREILKMLRASFM